MDSLPFIVPIAGFVLLVNGLWTCCQGRRVRILEARVGILEDTQTRPVAIPVHATPTAVYYPPYQAPMPQASAPPANFIRI
jgi:hypothetical protein